MNGFKSCDNIITYPPLTLLLINLRSSYHVNNKVAKRFIGYNCDNNIPTVTVSAWFTDAQQFQLVSISR